MNLGRTERPRTATRGDVHEHATNDTASSVCKLRSSSRWALFRRCELHESILSADMPQSHTQTVELQVLRLGRGGDESGVQTLPALPSRRIARAARRTGY